MKKRKRVSKRVKARGKVSKLAASSSAAGLGRKRKLTSLPEELAGMYRVVKKPVTVRLDADILEWFQRDGRGYQTRINRALREVMMKQKRAGR